MHWHWRIRHRHQDDIAAASTSGVPFPPYGDYLLQQAETLCRAHPGLRIAAAPGYWQAVIGPDGAEPDEQVVITRASLSALLIVVEGLLAQLAP